MFKMAGTCVRFVCQHINTPSSFVMESKIMDTLATRIVIPIDMSSGCCDGAPFLDDRVMDENPEILKGRLSREEWSAALRKLQRTVQDNTDSNCCVCTGFFCSPLIACIYFSNRRSKLEKKLSQDIGVLNSTIFGPRDMMIQFRAIESASCCSNGEYELVIALTREEVQRLALDANTGL
jgi:hypothetical protein